MTIFRYVLNLPGKDINLQNITVQLVWVPEHGIDGNKTADHLARQASPLPLIGPEPAVGTAAKVARGVIKGWTSTKHKECWQPIQGHRQAKGFL